MPKDPEENKKKGDTVQDVLRKEGQLIRNTGTNSIKSINVRLKNFEGVFNSIESNLVQQTSLLAKGFKLDEEGAKDAARQSKLGGATDADSDDDVGKKTKPSKSLMQQTKGITDAIKKGFSAKNLLIAGAITAVAPFVAGLLTGTIDELTDGKFTDMANTLKRDIPDAFAALKETVAALYGNVNDFLDSGDPQDLLKDKDGNDIVDLEKMKEKGAQYATQAVLLVMKGPIAALGATIGYALTNAVEDLTGVDIDDTAEMALATMLGLGASALTQAALLRWAMGSGSLSTGQIKRGLLYRTIMSLTKGPIMLIAAAMGLALYALQQALDNMRDQNIAAVNEANQKIKEAEQAAKAGDIEKAQEIVQDITESVTKKVANRELALPVVVAEDAQEVIVQQAEVQGEVLNQMLKEGFKPDQDNENVNKTRTILADLVDGIKYAEDQQTRLAFVNQIADALPAKLLYGALTRADIDAKTTPTKGQLLTFSSDIGNTLGVTRPEEIERLIVMSGLAETLMRRAQRESGGSSKAIDDLFKDPLEEDKDKNKSIWDLLGTDINDGKVDLLSSLSEQMNGGYGFGNMIIDSGNSYKAGDNYDSSDRSRKIYYTGTAIASNALVGKVMT